MNEKEITFEVFDKGPETLSLIFSESIAKDLAKTIIDNIAYKERMEGIDTENERAYTIPLYGKIKTTS